LLLLFQAHWNERYRRQAFGLLSRTLINIAEYCKEIKSNTLIRKWLFDQLGRDGYDLDFNDCLTLPGLTDVIHCASVT
jgi:recombinational DNA repair protein (RecF pathway)